MSQVYTSILRLVIANTFLLGPLICLYFETCIAMKNLLCLIIYLFTYLFIYLIFVYLIDFIPPIRQVSLEFSRTHFAQFTARSITFSVVDADWLNALIRFPISLC